MAGAGVSGREPCSSLVGEGLYMFTMVVSWTLVVIHSTSASSQHELAGTQGTSSLTNFAKL